MAQGTKEGHPYPGQKIIKAEAEEEAQGVSSTYATSKGILIKVPGLSLGPSPKGRANFDGDKVQNVKPGYSGVSK